MSDIAITVTAEQHAALLALLGGADAPVPSATSDAADLREYEVYRHRVTRGKPKSFAQWQASQTAKPTTGAKPTSSLPAVLPDSAQAVAKIAQRSDCVAVLKVGDALVGCYRFTRKADDADRFTMSGDGGAAQPIMQVLAAYVVATGPAWTGGK